MAFYIKLLFTILIVGLAFLAEGRVCQKNSIFKEICAGIQILPYLTLISFTIAILVDFVKKFIKKPSAQDNSTVNNLQRKLDKPTGEKSTQTETETELEEVIEYARSKLDTKTLEKMEDKPQVKAKFKVYIQNVVNQFKVSFQKIIMEEMPKRVEKDLQTPRAAKDSNDSPEKSNVLQSAPEQGKGGPPTKPMRAPPFFSQKPSLLWQRKLLEKESVLSDGNLQFTLVDQSDSESEEISVAFPPPLQHCSGVPGQHVDTSRRNWSGYNQVTYSTGTKGMPIHMSFLPRNSVKEREMTLKPNMNDQNMDSKSFGKPYRYLSQEEKNSTLVTDLYKDFKVPITGQQWQEPVQAFKEPHYRKFHVEIDEKKHPPNKDGICPSINPTQGTEKPSSGINNRFEECRCQGCERRAEYGVTSMRYHDVSNKTGGHTNTTQAPVPIDSYEDCKQIHMSVPPRERDLTLKPTINEQDVQSKSFPKHSSYIPQQEINSTLVTDPWKDVEVTIASYQCGNPVQALKEEHYRKYNVEMDQKNHFPIKEGNCPSLCPTKAIEKPSSGINNRFEECRYQGCERQVAYNATSRQYHEVSNIACDPTITAQACGPVDSNEDSTRIHMLVLPRESVNERDLTLKQDVKSKSFPEHHRYVPQEENNSTLPIASNQRGNPVQAVKEHHYRKYNVEMDENKHFPNKEHIYASVNPTKGTERPPNQGCERQVQHGAASTQHYHGVFNTSDGHTIKKPTSLLANSSYKDVKRFHENENEHRCGGWKPIPGSAMGQEPSLPDRDTKNTARPPTVYSFH